MEITKEQAQQKTKLYATLTTALDAVLSIEICLAAYIMGNKVSPDLDIGQELMPYIFIGSFVVNWLVSAIVASVIAFGIYLVKGSEYFLPLFFKCTWYVLIVYTTAVIATSVFSAFIIFNY